MSWYACVAKDAYGNANFAHPNLSDYNGDYRSTCEINA
ncbi:hypothetical protein DFP91_2818 [Pseudorhodoplanes sinuspersici]|nr:hypothetical protein DFP91_2818 [Pseudorhodoplanes sinuspersici]